MPLSTFPVAPRWAYWLKPLHPSASPWPSYTWYPGKFRQRQRARVHRTIHETRMVSSNGNQAQVERASELPNLSKVVVLGQRINALWHSTISTFDGELDRLATRLDTSRRPQSHVLVKRLPHNAVLAGKT
jgi:hypothetical protein